MLDYSTISLHDILALDSTETLVLTVNNRYARRVLGGLQASITTSQRTIAVPDIMPVSAWFRLMADELCFIDAYRPAAHVLDTFAMRYMWEQSIREVEGSEGALLDMKQAAALAADADALMDAWDIAIVEGEETPDYQQFAQWRQHYKHVLEDRDLDDANRSAERVRDAVEAGAYQSQVRHIVLVGFHETEPRFRRILHALAQQGVAIYQLHFESEPPQRQQLFRADDSDHEWRQAVQWAVAQLREHPHKRVAIVAAQLEQQVPFVHRLLADACQATESEVALGWNVAVGRALSEWPIARAALAWLTVCANLHRKQQLSPQDIGDALLLGHSVASLDEQEGRSALDAHWRKKAVLQLSTAQLQLDLQHHAPRLAAAWQQVVTHLNGFPSKASAAYWVEQMRALLQLLGFPGEQGLDSHNYQVMEALDNAFGQFARQAVVLPSISFAYAQSLFATLLRETVFQPQRDPHARIDVLGLLESEGGRWDAVWALGLTDEVLPAVVKPNPFLPITALRRVDAPRSTPERELAWAQLIFMSLCSSAPHLVCSYPQYEGEQLLRASPLLAQIADSYQGVPAPDIMAAEMEWVLDQYGPALASQSVMKGGATLLDTQARSPLWAFVKFRLHAAVLPEYAELANLPARGIFLHAVIEGFWKACEPRTREQLQRFLAQPDVQQQLSALVEHHAAQHLAEYSMRLRALECARAEAILFAWLQFESERDDFIVQQVEDALSWSHSMLQLSMRVDRVDELADGSLVVIDYKSSLNRRAVLPQWTRQNPNRPVELQLPLYAIEIKRLGAEVSALALAWLNTRSLGMNGYADSSVQLGQLVDRTQRGYEQLPIWSEQLQQWRVAIDGIAEEFCAGYAANQVYNRDDFLFCDTLPFLRLDEEQTWQ